MSDPSAKAASADVDVAQDLGLALKPSDKGSAVSRTLQLFVLLSVLACLVGFGTWRAGYTEAVRVAEGAASRALAAAGAQAEVHYASVFRDVGYLANSPFLLESLTEGDAGLIGAQTELMRYLSFRPTWAQLRVLGTDGREVVRLDRRAGSMTVVPDSGLQQKAHRGYFKTAIGAPDGAVRVSALDPNMEQHKIEYPLRPMLRFSAPLDYRGARVGVLVVNLDERSVLERLSAPFLSGGGAVSIRDAIGNWRNAGGEWHYEVGDGELALPDGLSDADIVTVEGRVTVEGPEEQGVVTLVTRGALPKPPGLTVAKAAPWVGGGAVVLLLLSWWAGRFWQSTHQARRALEDREKLFAAVLAGSPDPTLVVDATGAIIIANREAERAFGYSRAELLGSTVDRLVPDRYRAGHSALRQGYGANPEARPMAADNELTAVRQDGEEFPVTIALSGIRTALGLFVVCTIRDVSEALRTRKLAEANTALEEINARLTASNAELRAFSYSVAHDLRGPLRAVKSFGEALQEDAMDALDEFGREAVDAICSASERMGLIIDDLLLLAKVNRDELALEEVPLSELVEESVGRCRLHGETREISIHVEPGLSAWCDRRLIALALDNLIGNACKYTRDTERPVVRFGRRTIDSVAYFYVADNGCGFDMRYAETILKPFERLHTTEEFPGTGVGLGIVNRIVKKHGGHLFAEGEPGRGATFYFSLPGANGGSA